MDLHSESEEITRTARIQALLYSIPPSTLALEARRTLYDDSKNLLTVLIPHRVVSKIVSRELREKWIGNIATTPWTRPTFVDTSAAPKKESSQQKRRPHNIHNAFVPEQIVGHDDEFAGNLDQWRPCCQVASRITIDSAAKCAVILSTAATETVEHMILRLPEAAFDEAAERDKYLEDQQQTLDAAELANAGVDEAKKESAAKKAESDSDESSGMGLFGSSSSFSSSLSSSSSEECRSDDSFDCSRSFFSCHSADAKTARDLQGLSSGDGGERCGERGDASGSSRPLHAGAASDACPGNCEAGDASDGDHESCADVSGSESCDASGSESCDASSPSAFSVSQQNPLPPFVSTVEAFALLLSSPFPRLTKLELAPGSRPGPPGRSSVLPTAIANAFETIDAPCLRTIVANATSLPHALFVAASGSKILAELQLHGLISEDVERVLMGRFENADEGSTQAPLRELHLSNASMSADCFFHLSPTLTRLRLGNCSPLTPYLNRSDSPAFWRNALRKLTSLELSTSPAGRCAFTAKSFTAMCVALQNSLTTLLIDVTRDQLPDSARRSIGRLKNLQRLRLSEPFFTPLSEVSDTTVHQHDRDEVLDGTLSVATFSARVTEHERRSDGARNDGVESNADYLDDGGGACTTTSVFQHMPNLTWADLDRCRGLRDEDFAVLQLLTSSMETLRIGSPKSFGDEACRAVSSPHTTDSGTSTSRDSVGEADARKQSHNFHEEISNVERRRIERDCPIALTHLSVTGAEVPDSALTHLQSCSKLDRLYLQIGAGESDTEGVVSEENTITLSQAQTKESDTKQQQVVLCPPGLVTLCSLPFVTDLELTLCHQVPPSHWAALKRCRCLDHVSFPRKITSVALRALTDGRAATTLRLLGIRNCTNITGGELEELLPKFQNLKCLYACNTRVTSTALLQLLQSNPTMTNFDLSDCRGITDEGFATALSLARSAVSISASDTNFGPLALRAVALLPFLRSLHAGPRVTDDDEAVLRGMTQLRAFSGRGVSREARARLGF